MSDPTPAPGAREIRPLTGIRGIAALWVVFYHAFAYWVILLPPLDFAKELFFSGYLGVSVFFILSGFILSYVYQSAREKFRWSDYQRFLWMRFARIYPNHFVTLTLLVVLVGLASLFNVNLAYSSYPWSGLPYHYTMTQTWPLTNPGTWNLPAWSIGSEWFAYVFMFPLSVILLRHLRNRWVLLGVALLLLYFEARFYPFFEKLDYERPWAIPMVCCEFIAGSLLFGVWQQGGWLVAACQKYATWIFLAVPVFIFQSYWPFLGSAAVIRLLIAFLLLGMMVEQSAFARFLSTPLLTWLGRLSYAIYLSHSFALQFLRFVTPPERFAESSFAVRFGVFAANVLLILVLGALLYYLVEVPARNWLRARARRKPVLNAVPEPSLKPNLPASETPAG